MIQIVSSLRMDGIPPYRCVICGGAVVSEDAWVETDVTGRVWFCPDHWTDDLALVWQSQGGGALIAQSSVGKWKLWPRPLPERII